MCGIGYHGHVACQSLEEEVIGDLFALISLLLRLLSVRFFKYAKLL